MFGKLTWDAIPWSHPIPLFAGFGAFGIVGAIVLIVILRGHAPYLWREWITSCDHKRIGVMYVFLAGVMILRGLTDAKYRATVQLGSSALFLRPSWASR